MGRLGTIRRAWTRTPHRYWRLAIFVLGLAVSAVMVLRTQVTVDQFNLLARGWRFAVQGELIPYGVWATGGGFHPGSVTSLLVGLPLLVWEHHRSPVLLVLASHVVAYLLLQGTLRRILGADEQLLFAVFYWLSPWRLFYSGFLWNPSLLFVCGALHLWTASRLRVRAGFWLSFGHLLVLGVAAQINLSAVLLIVSSALLWWRRYLRLHLGGALAGAGVVGLSLVPWLLAMIQDPARLPISQSALGYGLLAVTPVVQGIMNWLRFAAVGLSRSMACLDFSSVGGPGLETLGTSLAALRIALATVTLTVAAWANWKLWRLPSGPAGAGAEADRRWLRGVVQWSFVGALVVFGLSPIGLTAHALLSVLHLAVLPLVFAVGSLVKGRRRAVWVPGVHVYASLMIVLGLGLALGSPPYRCGGPRCETKRFTVPRLVADHPMLDDLEIRDTCAPIVGDPKGWWPDGLEPPAALASRAPSARSELEAAGRTRAD